MVKIAVRSSHYETKRATRWRLTQEEEQERHLPNRLRGLAQAEVGAAQTSGWASRHLVVDLATALAGPRPNLQLWILSQNNMSTLSHSLWKVRLCGLGRARTQEAVRLQIHDKMAKPRTTLTNSWPKMWDRLAGLGLASAKTGVQLEAGRGRSCWNCTLEQTDL